MVVAARKLLAMTRADPHTEEAVNVAFRRLAKTGKLHPDQGGDAERFKEVNLAVQFLKDVYAKAARLRDAHPPPAPRPSSPRPPPTPSPARSAASAPAAAQASTPAAAPRSPAPSASTSTQGTTQSTPRRAPNETAKEFAARVRAAGGGNS